MKQGSATLLAWDFTIKYLKSMDFGQIGVLSHLTLSQSVPNKVIADFQAEFNIDILTNYYPVTFDKTRSITEDILLQTVKQFIILAGRTSKFFPTTPTVHSWKVSADAANPSRLSKNLFCLGNMWLSCPCSG